MPRGRLRRDPEHGGGKRRRSYYQRRNPRAEVATSCRWMGVPEAWARPLPGVCPKVARWGRGPGFRRSFSHRELATVRPPRPQPPQTAKAEGPFRAQRALSGPRGPFGTGGLSRKFRRTSQDLAETAWISPPRGAKRPMGSRRRRRKVVPSRPPVLHFVDLEEATRSCTPGVRAARTSPRRCALGSPPHLQAGATLEDCDLTGADLTGADLTGLAIGGVFPAFQTSGFASGFLASGRESAALDPVEPRFPWSRGSALFGA